MEISGNFRQISKALRSDFQISESLFDARFEMSGTSPRRTAPELVKWTDPNGREHDVTNAPPEQSMTSGTRYPYPIRLPGPTRG